MSERMTSDSTSHETRRDMVASRPATRDQIMLAMRNMQESQRQLTVANSRASAMALMMGFSNRAENARLAREQKMIQTRLALGERALGDLQGQVEEQATSISNVSEQVQEQEESIDHLQKQVRDQQKYLGELVEKYQQELDEQRRLILEHRQEFGRLVISKLKQDATLDAVILLFSWIFVQTPIVSLPVSVFSFVSGSLPLVPLQRKNRSSFVAQIARMGVLLFCARSLRIVAARNGLHNAVGTPQVYFIQSMEMLQTLFKMKSRNFFQSNRDQTQQLPSAELVSQLPSQGNLTINQSSDDSSGEPKSSRHQGP